MYTKDLYQKLSKPGAAANGISLFVARLCACKGSRLSFEGRQPSKGGPSLKSQSGQIIVEYILLLFISVGIATFLTKQLINRSPENPGIITGTWSKINNAIGADIID